jgi:hypothetical protein
VATFSLTKDKDAKLDYGVDWSAWLGTDTIVASTWTVEGPGSALILSDDDFSPTITSFWLDGGTTGQSYTLTNHITTAAGREDDRSITVSIAER